MDISRIESEIQGVLLEKERVKQERIRVATSLKSVLGEIENCDRMFQEDLEIREEIKRIQELNAVLQRQIDVTRDQEKVQENKDFPILTRETVEPPQNITENHESLERIKNEFAIQQEILQKEKAELAQMRQDEILGESLEEMEPIDQENVEEIERITAKLKNLEKQDIQLKEKSAGISSYFHGSVAGVILLFAIYFIK